MTTTESPDDSSIPKPKFWQRHHGRYGLCLIIALLLIYFIKHHYAKQDTNIQDAPVVIAEVTHKNVPIYLTGLGNVTPTYTVTVKTQVNGLLMRVLYKEGQWVKKGDLLAEIDKRPLMAQLTQYQGQLMRDEALLANALIDRGRYQQLRKQDFISQQTLATQDSLVKKYQGAIEMDNGLIQSTKVNLLYCDIISPIDGRVGLRLVDPGNFVQTSDTSGLLIVTTTNPATVIFTIPEDDVPSLLPQVFSNKTIAVKAYDRHQNQLLATGKLLTMDNVIDPTTGTVKLRAQFDNKDNKLFANQFVVIKLLVTHLTHATVVPTASIQHGNNGDFVYLFNPNSTVRIRPVKVILTSGDDTAIQDDLKSGQKVVVDGADKLTNGTKVKILQKKT